MKKTGLLALLVLFLTSWASFGQNPDKKFKMEGINPFSITVNQTFSESVEIFPFDKNGKPFYGLDVSANIELNGDKALVRLLLIDNNFNEHLIYEGYNLLLEEESSFSIEKICEETSVLDNVLPYSLQIEIKNAKLELKSLSYSTTLEQGKNIAAIKKEKKKAQNEEKINKINKNLKKQGKSWVAGPTAVSELSYSDRKKLYGQSTFPAGFEYYAGGVISASSTESTSSDDGSLKSATTSTSPYVDEWDWRDRHGRNWITPVTDQLNCGSCWTFAATGAVEAMANLNYNQLLNLDLSEQDLLSCSNGGDCVSGFPHVALNYITSTGIVDENTFPYSGTLEPSENKGNTPTELIKISGRMDFGYSAYPREVDVLKDMIIQFGPLSSGLNDWNHALVLVGYKIVREGDTFFFRDLDLSRSWKSVESGDPLMGKTVWIFKNSWGADFGDEGYVYVETPISNVGWTHAVKLPLISEVKTYDVVCEDRDGDGYYWWGLGEKPATCTGPDQPDGNDADATLGPLDEYGFCIPLNGTPVPVANFTADSTIVMEGQEVTFSDNSTNNPVEWLWNFEGGEPATSTLKNPKVKYNAANNYRVSLTVTNDVGSDTKIADNFVQVEEAVPSYCSASGNPTNEWITGVEINGQSKTSGASAYSNFTSIGFDLSSGASQEIVLTPGFNSRSKFEYWGVWIDLNQDMAFSDTEKVFTASKVKTVISGTIIIPAGLNITTRMRVVMSKTAPTACGTFDGGEVEDYSVNITEPAPQPPVADFTVSKTNIAVGESIQFTNTSLNNPTSFQWYFDGGDITESNNESPFVTYNSPGSYEVTLIVSGDLGTSQKSITISVSDQIDNTPVYCTPENVSSSRSYIRRVVFDGLDFQSEGSGYQLPESTIDNLYGGQVYFADLYPSSNKTRNFWRIWIDFNMDGDFDDSDETVLVKNGLKGLVSANITIPNYATGTTRMRIAMKVGKAPAPCEGNFEGEIEDYFITFEAPELKASALNQSLDPEPQNTITVYPNPTSNFINIGLENPGYNDFYTIHDLSGKILINTQITSSSTKVDLSTYSSGIYLIKVVSNSQSLTKKIIKND